MTHDDLISVLRGTVQSYSAALDNIDEFTRMARAGRVPGPVAIDTAEGYVARERAAVARLTNLLFMLTRGDDTVQH